MRVAIIGYGKMGKEIEQVLLERGHEITLRATTKVPFTAADLANTEVAIEFTTPHTAVDNILTCFDADCPVVVGSTGWYNRLPEVRTEASNRQQSLLYASNFSIGVNVLFHINKALARIMSNLDQYTPSIHEIHHLAKLDKPSGTAITLAEGVIDETPRLTGWQLDEASDATQLAIISERIGEVPGTHHVSYTSSVDQITLTHEAFSRRGFALGSVLAAEWLHGKKGVYSIHDFLKF